MDKEFKFNMPMLKPDLERVIISKEQIKKIIQEGIITEDGDNKNRFFKEIAKLLKITLGEI